MNQLLLVVAECNYDAPGVAKNKTALWQAWQS